VRALDRLLLALRAPRARSRAAYRVLVTIAALDQRAPRPVRVPAGARKPRYR
jgi:hypothetical protein